MQAHQQTCARRNAAGVVRRCLCKRRGLRAGYDHGPAGAAQHVLTAPYVSAAFYVRGQAGARARRAAAGQRQQHKAGSRAAPRLRDQRRGGWSSL